MADNTQAENWNKMWDMWSENKLPLPLSELLTYDSEVNNGGHYQYFDSLGYISDVKKSVAIVKKLLPLGLKLNLAKAYRAYVKSLKEIDVDEIMEKCDNYYYSKESAIENLLNKHANKF